MWEARTFEIGVVKGGASNRREWILIGVGLAGDAYGVKQHPEAATAVAEPPQDFHQLGAWAAITPLAPLTITLPC